MPNSCNISTMSSPASGFSHENDGTNRSRHGGKSTRWRIGIVPDRRLSIWALLTSRMRPSHRRTRVKSFWQTRSPIASINTPSLSRSMGSSPHLEITIAYARQLLDEGHNGPNFVVGHLDGAKARHAGHVDAILDRPEQLLRRALVGYILEVGRIRM